MNIIAVDDERSALWTLEQAIKSVCRQACVTSFSSAYEALEYAGENRVDVAFLDIEMAELNGLFLAKKLKDIYGRTNIIFVTGYSNYTLNAFDLYASGYVLKPIDPERVAYELENLRNPVALPDKGIRVQCFGNFEIFVNGRPVTFTRSKSKEALAFLVDRQGAGVSKKELSAVLLDDRPYTRGIQSYIHTIMTEMIQSLKNVGADDIVIKKHNLYAVDPSRFTCDYYRYNRGEQAAVNSYRGEYMVNYEWAEFTTGHLSNDNF